MPYANRDRDHLGPPNLPGMVGEGDALPGASLCPECGQRKSEAGELCRSCKARASAKRKEEQHDAQRRVRMEDTRPRFDAAMDAGWPVAELMRRAAERDPPTWGEILKRAPEVVIRSWWERS